MPRRCSPGRPDPWRRHPAASRVRHGSAALAAARTAACARRPGAADRTRSPVPSACHRTGARPLPLPARPPCRRARRVVRREPGGSDSGRHRNASTAQLLAGSDLERALLRRSGDARADRSRALTPGSESAAVRSVPLLGTATGLASAVVIRRARRYPPLGIHPRTSLARVTWQRATRQACGDRRRSGSARPAALALHVPPRRLSMGGRPGLHLHAGTTVRGAFARVASPEGMRVGRRPTSQQGFPRATRAYGRAERQGSKAYKTIPPAT